MQETQNYKLKKIDKETDKILDSIDYLNKNFDDIDEVLSKKIDEIGDASNTTVTFTESEEKAELKTGDTLSVLFGKIKKWLSGLKAVAFSGSYNDLEEKLTAGNNITIENGVISSTGGGGGEITNSPTTSIPIYTIWVGTQEQYEAIETLDANTMYNIIEE